MGVSSSFINNFNIMLFFTFLFFLASLSIYLIAIKLNSAKGTYVGLVLLKQGVLTLAIFNVFNLSFSMALHLKYQPNQSSMEYWSSLTGIALAVILWLGIILGFLCTSKKGYGEFKTAFKKDCVC